jgi:biotin synthase-related radical SAM superfamily protein
VTRIVAGAEVCTRCDCRYASYRGLCFDCNALKSQICTKCGIDHAEMAHDAIQPRLQEAIDMLTNSGNYRGDAKRAVLEHAAEMARQAACRIDMYLKEGV